MMKINLKEILLLIEKKQFKESLKHLNELIEGDSNNFNLYYLRGIVDLNLEKFDKAVNDFSLAINIKKDNHIFYHYRGIAYLKSNDLYKAEKDFNELISLKSDFAEAYNNLGILYVTDGQNQKAIENFNKAIELKGNFKNAIFSLINALSHTENVKNYNSKIINTHNQINKLFFDYSKDKKILDENIKNVLKLSYDIVDKNINISDFNISQIYRRNKADLICKRHKKIFNTYDVIPQFCFGCYKVQIEPKNIIDLIKLYIIFDNINLENNNLRKCFVEFRSNIKGKYKGLIYCSSLNEAKNINFYLKELFKKNFDDIINSKIKRGCSHYGLKYPEYENLETNIMEYKSDWSKYENLIDKQFPSLSAKMNIGPTIKGISLSDVLVIRNWIAYAKLIDDQSYKLICDFDFNSDFLSKKLKGRNFN